MIDIAVLRAMAAAGATIEMILAAIEVDQIKWLEKLAAKRSQDAARQRRSRERKAAEAVTSGHAVSRGVTVTHAVSQDVTSPTPPLKKESKKEQCSKPKRVSRTARSIPNDWQPDREFPKKYEWSESKIDHEADRFRNHAKANGRICKDWMAAWRNWVTSPYQKPERSNEANRRISSNGTGGFSAYAAECARKAAEDLGPKSGHAPDKAVERMGPGSGTARGGPIIDN